MRYFVFSDIGSRTYRRREREHVRRGMPCRESVTADRVNARSVFGRVQVYRRVAVDTRNTAVDRKRDFSLIDGQRRRLVDIDDKIVKELVCGILFVGNHKTVCSGRSESVGNLRAARIFYSGADMSRGCRFESLVGRRPFRYGQAVAVDIVVHGNTDNTDRAAQNLQSCTARISLHIVAEFEVVRSLAVNPYDIECIRFLVAEYARRQRSAVGERDIQRYALAAVLAVSDGRVVYGSIQRMRFEIVNHFVNASVFGNVFRRAPRNRNFFCVYVERCGVFLRFVIRVTHKADRNRNGILSRLPRQVIFQRFGPVAVNDIAVRRSIGEAALFPVAVGKCYGHNQSALFVFRCQSSGVAQLSRLGNRNIPDRHKLVGEQGIEIVAERISAETEFHFQYGVCYRIMQIYGHAARVVYRRGVARQNNAVVVVGVRRLLKHIIERIYCA